MQAAQQTVNSQQHQDEEAMTRALEAQMNATQDCEGWHARVSKGMPELLRQHKDAIIKQHADAPRQPVPDRLEMVR